MKLQLKIALGAVLLGAIACTCGPLANITQIAQDAQEIAPTAAAAATLAGELQENAEALEGLEEFGEIPVDPDAPEFEFPEADAGIDISLENACDLVSEDEVSNAFGLPVSQLLGNPPVAEQAVCTSIFEDNRVYIITIQDNNNADVAAQNFNILQTSFAPTESVSGPSLQGAAWSEESSILIAYSGRYLITSASFEGGQAGTVAATSLYAQRLP